MNIIVSHIMLSSCLLFIYLFDWECCYFINQCNQSFFSHATRSFLCFFVRSLFLFSFSPSIILHHDNIICDTIIFIIYHAINIYIKYISLYLHGRHSMVERKTRRVWKSHEGIGYCQENGSLRNGFGTSQGDRVYQGLRKQIK